MIGITHAKTIHHITIIYWLNTSANNGASTYTE